jgi:hypothetical protein
MVKKSKKPKYCEKVNIFSGICLYTSTNVSLLFWVTNKIYKNYPPLGTIILIN